MKRSIQSQFKYVYVQNPFMVEGFVQRMQKIVLIVTKETNDFRIFLYLPPSTLQIETGVGGGLDRMCCRHGDPWFPLSPPL